MKIKSIPALVLLLAAAFFSSCNPKITPVATVPGIGHEPERKVLNVSFDTTAASYGQLMRKKTVAKIYQDSNGRPIWFRDERLTAQGDSLIHILQRTNYFGLPRTRYHWPEVATYANAESSEEVLQRLEILMTDAFISLVHDLRYGLQHTGRNDSLGVAQLREFMDGDNLNTLLAAQEPQHGGYQKLKGALRNLLDSLSPTGDSLPDIRFELIALNLERWRSDTLQCRGRYAFVNIPSYQIHIVDGGDTLITSRVIVGKPEHSTPLLSSVIDCFTVYPYWHVPRKIAVEEYLPLIQVDTSFLTKNNFDVLDRKGVVLKPSEIRWTDFTKNYFPVSLRQREGTENALGLIKFHFDNPYAVYIHDTNAKKLFRGRQRAFSHGCVRMEKAEEFAHYLLMDKIGVRSKMIERYVAQKKRSLITVAKPLPIHIRYFTAEVIHNTLVFYDDVYDLDPPLLEKLFGAKGVSTL